VFLSAGLEFQVVQLYLPKYFLLVVLVLHRFVLSLYHTPVHNLSCIRACCLSMYFNCTVREPAVYRIFPFHPGCWAHRLRFLLFTYRCLLTAIIRLFLLPSEALSCICARKSMFCYCSSIRVRVAAVNIGYSTFHHYRNLTTR